MSRKSTLYILVSYSEYLMDQGLKSDYYYVGDASRFLRFLLCNARREDISQFLSRCAGSDSYRRRVRKTLRKLYQFAQERLGATSDPTTDL